MPSSLEKLNELVRLAEARTRAKKLESEGAQAAERLRDAERRAREATLKVREVKPLLTRQIEQADADEIQLKELIKKLAQFKSALDADANAETLIDASRAEIDGTRRTSRAALEEAAREADESRKALRGAIDAYQSLRREIDRLQPHLAPTFATDDRLLWEAEVLFPGGEFQALAREVEAASPHFGLLTRAEQYAQLKVWIGRYRQLQDTASDDVPDDALAASLRLFHQLKNLSKVHEPGYIEAFRHDYQTDWAPYILDAQDQLAQAVESARASREREHSRDEAAVRDSERQAFAREAGKTSLAELKALMARVHLPDEGLEPFLDLLKQTVNGLGASEPELLDLALPFREHISGGNGLRALRRNLDRIRQEEIDAGPDPLRAQFADLIAATQGKRAVIVGGSPREDSRKALFRLFEFDRLDWEPLEDGKTAALDSLEQSIRNQGVDLILLLRSFISHSVTDRLRPLAQHHDIPCLLVDHGYGAAAVGEALRKGLLKTA